MASTSRRISPDKQRAHLEKRHRRLKARVSQYEERLSLTPEEAADLRQLKKQKLACKDEMAKLTR